MWKSFVLELHGEWPEFVDECIGLSASVEISKCKPTFYSGSFVSISDLFPSEGFLLFGRDACSSPPSFYSHSLMSFHSGSSVPVRFSRRVDAAPRVDWSPETTASASRCGHQVQGR